jgi:small subunit ribosomal protein S20
MAHSASAIKRIRQNDKRQTHNKTLKADMRTAVKKALTAIESKADNQDELIRIAQEKVDKAVQKGIIHRNTGDRRKSRLARARNTTG